MKKKISIVICSIALVALIAVGATLALFTDKAEIDNVVTMGNVQISLTEPGFVHEDNTITNVMPGQEITKDPTITNDGDQDAYIRAKLTFTGLEAADQALVEENLDIDGTQWIKGDDGYFYLQTALASGDSVKLFNTVTIPLSWDNDYVNASFTLTVTAEAVQAQYYNPTVDGVINSWTGVEVVEFPAD